MEGEQRQSSQCYDLESQAKLMAKEQSPDAPGAYELAAEAYTSELSSDETNERLAAGQLRCLRKSDRPLRDVAPLVEAHLVRFPESQRVLSAAGFLLVDFAKAHSSEGRLDVAARSLADAFAMLPKLKDSSYLSMSLISGLRYICEKILEASPRDMEAAVTADLCLDATEPYFQKWLSALLAFPKQTTNKGPGAPERACLVIRKLAVRAERWDYLTDSMAYACDAGIHNQWLEDARVRGHMELGEMEEAAKVVQDAIRRHPNCETLSRKQAAIRMAVGDTESARETLIANALTAQTPWAWRDLASFYQEEANLTAMEQALLSGLSLHDLREPGPVWRLHFTLAEFYFDAGDEPASARELYLASESRRCGEWGQGTDIRSFLSRNATFLEQHLKSLEENPTLHIRRRTMKLYRKARTNVLRAHAQPATVTSLRSAFGFLKLASNGHSVFFRTSDAKGAHLEIGQAVNAVIVPSYDQKKQRETLRAVWFESPTKTDSR